MVCFSHRPHRAGAHERRLRAKPRTSGNRHDRLHDLL